MLKATGRSAVQSPFGFRKLPSVRMGTEACFQTSRQEHIYAAPLHPSPVRADPKPSMPVRRAPERCAELRSDEARFTIVDLGSGKIGLHNAKRNRYLTRVCLVRSFVPFLCLKTHEVAYDNVLELKDLKQVFKPIKSFDLRLLWLLQEWKGRPQPGEGHG